MDSRTPIDEKAHFMNQEPTKNAPMRVAGTRKRKIRKSKRKLTRKFRKVR